MAKEDKNQKLVREIMQRPENKNCFDCGEKGPVYVCSDFSTFVCTACSGIHRDFNHRVKSVSMTFFKPEEVEKLKAGGNKVARDHWLATWTPDQYPLPDSQNPRAVKDFMQKKYEEKRWIPKQKVQATPSFAEYPRQPAATKQDPQPEPLTNILGPNIPPLNVTSSPAPSPAMAPSHATPAPTPTPAPAPAPAPKPAPIKPTGDPLLDWNPQPMPGAQPVAPANAFIADFGGGATAVPAGGGFANFAAFPSVPSHSVQPTPQMQPQFNAFPTQQPMTAAHTPVAMAAAPAQQQSFFPAFGSQATPMVATAPVMQPVAPQNLFAPVPAPAAPVASMQMYGAAPMMSTAAAAPMMAAPAPAGQSFFPVFPGAAPATAPAHSYAHYAQPIQLQSFSYTPVPANQLFMANPTSVAATPQPGGFGAFGTPAAQPVAATPAPPKQPEPSPFANLDPLRGMKMQLTPAPVMTPSKPAAPTLGSMPAYQAQPQPAAHSASNGNNDFDWLK